MAGGKQRVADTPRSNAAESPTGEATLPGAVMSPSKSRERVQSPSTSQGGQLAWPEEPAEEGPEDASDDEADDADKREKGRHSCSSRVRSCWSIPRSLCADLRGEVVGAERRWLRRSTLIRRCFRLGLVTSLLIAFILLDAFMLGRQSHSSMVAVPLSRDLQITVEECRVVIIVADVGQHDLGLEVPSDFRRSGNLPSCSDADGCAVVWYSAILPWGADVDSWSERDDGQAAEFVLRNQDVDVEACGVFVLLETGASLAALNITCLGNSQCLITTDTHQATIPAAPATAWAVEGSLTVTAGGARECSSKFSSLHAGILDINCRTGDIFLEEIGVGTAGTVQAQFGDIYAEVLVDTNVVWQDSTSFYCFASPATPTVVTSQTCETAFNGTVLSEDFNATINQLVSRCSGQANLCRSAGCSDGTEALPSLVLRCPRGSYYVTSRQGDEEVESAAGVGFTYDNTTLRYGVAFNEESVLELQESIRGVLEDATRSDIAFVVSGSGHRTKVVRPANGFIFGVVPSRPYALLRPWWISFISMCLLMKEVRPVPVRLRTGPCPYTATLSFSAIGDIHQQIVDIALPWDENVAAYITARTSTPGEHPSMPHEATSWKPFRSSSTHRPETWWEIEPAGEGEYGRTMLHYYDDGTLLAAVIISVIVALLSAVFMLDVALRAVSVLVTVASLSGSHVRRYDRLMAAEHASRTAKQAGVSVLVQGPAQDGSGVPLSLSEKRLFDRALREQPTIDSLRIRTTTPSRLAVDAHLATLHEDDGGTASAPSGCRGRLKSCCRRRSSGKNSSDTDKADLKLEDMSATSFLRAGARVRIIPIWNLPPLFGIVDHIGVQVRRHFEHSLDAFLDLEGVVTDSAESRTVLLCDVKNLYGQYCFLHTKDEANLRCKEAQAKFRKRGLQVQEVQSREQPVAFTRVRLKSEREVERWSSVLNVETRSAPLPGETSLDFFLRMECELTGFDADTILVDDFKSRYAWFCEKNRVADPVSISKALMAEKHIQTTTVALFKVVPLTPPGKAGSTVKVFSVEAAKKHIKLIRHNHSGVSTVGLDRTAWLIDALCVLAHSLVIIVAAVPFVMHSFWTAVYEKEFASGSHLLTFSVTNLVEQPRLALAQLTRSYWSVIPMIWAAIQCLWGYLELVIHYSEQQFPVDTLRYFAATRAYLHAQPGADTSKSVESWVRRAMHTWQWAMLYIQLFIMFFLISLMLVWCILGAIISPESFLAYATAASTLVTFVLAQYGSMRRIYNGGLAEVMKSLEGTMGAALNRTLRTLIDYGEGQITSALGSIKLPQELQGVSLPPELRTLLGSAAGGAGGDGIFNRAALRQHTTMLSGSSLGKKITSAGFDVALVVDLATGDTKAINRFAEELGLPLEIGQLVAAVAEGDCPKAVDALEQLLMKYQRSSPLPPQFAKALAELAFSPSRPKVEKCVAASFQFALPAILELTLDSFVAAKAGGSNASGQPMEASASEAIDSDAEIRALLESSSPVASKTVAASKLVSTVARTEAGEVLAATIAKGGMSKSKRDAILALMMEVLPTLLKGILALLTSQNYQAFVESLRYVHSTILSQRRRYTLCFGETMYNNFRNVGAILHVLDLVLSTDDIEEAILNILQEDSILKLPTSVSNFIRLALWLRPPRQRQDLTALTALQSEFMVSYSARRKVIVEASRFFRLPKEISILLELIMAFALEDHRALVDENFKFGEKLTDLIVLLAGRRHVKICHDEGSKELLVECFRAATTLLATLHLGRVVDGFVALQNRTGLERGQMTEILELYMFQAETSAQEPPAGMSSWQLMRAASSCVKVGIAETVGLAHVILGHSQTPEAGAFIRELMRRQGLVPHGIDRLLTSLLSVTTSKSTRLVMKALRELRVHGRFLSLVGLGSCPPRYISEELFKEVGIEDRDILNARIDVPYSFEDDPDAWVEWLDRLSMSLFGLPDTTPWKSLKLKRRDEHGIKILKNNNNNNNNKEPSRRERRAESRRAVERRNAPSHTVAASNPATRQALEGLELSLSSLSQSNEAPPTAATTTVSLHRSMTEGLLQCHLKHRSGAFEEMDGADDLWRQLAGKHRARRRQKRSEVETPAKRGISGVLPNSMGQSKSEAPAQAAKDDQGVLSPTSVPQQRYLAADGEVMSPTSPSAMQAVPTEVAASATQAAASAADGVLVSPQLQNLTDDLFTSESAQLQWLKPGEVMSEVVEFLVDHYNDEIKKEPQGGSMMMAGGHYDRSKQPVKPAKDTLLLHEVKDAFTPKTGQDYSESYGKRQLLELQDTSTGSLHSLHLSSGHKHFMEQVLMLRDVLNPMLRVKSGPSLARRGMVVQNLAALLGVGQRDMALLFDLLCPEHTKDVERAITSLGKANLPERVAAASASVAYTARRTVPVFDYVRKMLQKLAWRFQLPRFLAPAALLPVNPFPAHFRDVCSVTHFVCSAILRIPKYNSAMQLVIYDLAMLVSGAPPNPASLLKVFGLAGPSVQEPLLAQFLGMMMRESMEDKLCALQQVFGWITSELQEAEVQQAMSWALPYLLFFSGFPFAEVVEDDTWRRSAAAPQAGTATQAQKTPSGAKKMASVLQILNRDTGIPKEILSGIEISLRSISARSSSDKVSFSRDSVLGLLLPLFKSARDTFPHRKFPTDGLIKSLVSLSYCKMDHLEYMAEALHMNTFVLQLIVILVDISRHKEDDVYISQMMQQIHASAEIVATLPKMGLKQSFVALIEMSFPRISDVQSLPGLLDQLGLGSLVSCQVVSLQYAIACCLLLHMRGVADEQLHGHHTDVVLRMMGGLCNELGFHYPAVPTMAARIFQGDFRVVFMNNSDIPLLLPFAVERDLCAVIAGALSQVPPHFTYEPVVLSGVVSLNLRRPEETIKVIVHTDTRLPSRPAFDIRVLDVGEEHSGLNLQLIARTTGHRRRFELEIAGLPITFKGLLEVRWRAWPAECDTVDDLRSEQHRRASQSLRQLEKFCWNWRMHWGGMAGMWWDKIDVHPLFLLIANGDISAMRLASDLLGLPEEILAFLMANIALAPAHASIPLLLADMCVRPVLRRFAAKDQLIDCRPLDPAPTGRSEQHPPCDELPPLDATSAAFQPVKSPTSKGSVMVSEPDRQSEGAGRENLDIDLDDSSDDDCADAGLPAEDELSEHERKRTKIRSAEDIGNLLKFLGQDAIPDELRCLFESDDMQLSSWPEKMGQALWTQWRFERDGRCVSGTAMAFERAAIDCFKELWNPEPMDMSVVAIRMQSWEALPENLHLLTSLMLLQLYHLLEPTPDLQEGIADAPSLALMHFLSRLHQTRRLCSSRKVPMTAEEAERLLIPACLGLEIHLRHSQPALRDNLAEEVKKTTQKQAMIWQDEAFASFKLPAGFADQLLTLPEDDEDAGNDEVTWSWHSWEWPMDEITRMCQRVMQVTRLALGIAEPLVCYHPSDEDFEEIVEAMQVHKKADERMAADSGRKLSTEAEKIVRRGWSVLLDLDEETGILNQLANKVSIGKDLQQARLRLMDDLLDGQSMSLLLALAAGGADPVDGYYSINGALMPASAKALANRAPLYDALSSMLTTCCDELYFKYMGGVGFIVVWYKDGSNVLIENLEDLENASGKYEEVAGNPARLLHGGTGQLLRRTARDSDEAEEALDLWCQKYVQELQQRPARSASSALLKLLPRESQLSHRSSQWSHILCPEVGLDIHVTETMMQIAHRLVEDSKGQLVNARAFEGFSKRLRLGAGGADVLQALSTPTWDPGNAEVLGSWLGFDGTLIHGIMVGSVSEVKGWILIYDFLSGQSHDSAKFMDVVADHADMMVDQATSFMGGKDIVKASKQARKRLQAAVLRNNGDLPSQTSKADDFIEACLIFNALDVDKRSGTVRDQRRWLDGVVQTLLPLLLVDYPCWHDQEKAPLLSTIAALLLHLMAGQNLAAVQLLLRGSQDPSPRSPRDWGRTFQAEQGTPSENEASARVLDVFGLNGQARNLWALMLLAGTGVETLDHRVVSDAASTLTPPIAAFVREKAEAWVAAQNGKATPATVINNTPSAHDSPLDMTLDDMHKHVRLLLETVLSMAISDTKRFLRVIKEVTEVQMERILEVEGSWLLKEQPSEIPGGKEEKRRAIKRFAKQRFSHSERKQLIQLIIREDVVKALVLVQSLRTLQKLKGGQRKKNMRTTRAASSRGAYALTTMVTALHVNFLRQRNASQPVVLDSVERNSTLRLFGLNEDAAPLPLSWIEEGLDLSPNSPRRQTLETVSEVERADSALPPVAACKTLTSQEEGLKAMEFVFIAFAASRRGELQRKNSYNMEQYMEEFELLLPLMTGMATGRLELFLLECRNLAAYLVETAEANTPDSAEHSRWLTAIDVIIDVFTLVGMDATLFLKMTSECEDDTNEFLLPSLMQVLFQNSVACMGMSKESEQELKGIINLLGRLLLGLSVGAPPDFTNELIMKLVKPLEHHAQRLVKGDARMERASSELISSTRRIAAMAAEGKSVQQMDLFSPGADGEQPPALVILQACLDLLTPFLPEQAQEPLIALVKALTELSLLSQNPTVDGFEKHAPLIVEQLAVALGVPRHTITGIMALVQGKWQEAANLCRPFCDLNPEALDQMVRLLPAVKQTVSSGRDLLNKLSDFDLEDVLRMNNQAQGRQRQVEKRVSEGGGTARDLFIMVDLDGNGSISKDEFRTCALRLGLTLSEHRVIEIFSRCKKVRGHQQLHGAESTDLNVEEFEQALQYLEGKIAHDCLKLLGISWGALMFYLAYMTLILILIFVFIFLGISVFVTTGVFGTIVNSIMTIAAGLGLSKSSSRDRVNDVGEQAKTQEVLDEVKDTVFNNQ